MSKVPHISNRHGITGLRWLSEHAKSWDLSDAELAGLLGVTPATLHNWWRDIRHSGSQDPELPAKVVEQVGLLLGLHKALVLLTPSGHEEMAAEWFTKPVSLWGLNGNSIREYLLNNPGNETLVALVGQIRSASA